MAARRHSMNVMTSSESPEYYTPASILRLARDVLGSIDLDPASCAEANLTVQAARYYTAEQNGLLHPWDSPALWLNPPFGSALDAFVERLVDSYESGSVGAAIALVPARVDTKWWRRLAPYPVCFVRGRVRYVSMPNAAPFPTALVYLGSDEARFMAVFRTLGPIWRCVDTGRAAHGRQLLLGLEAVG